LPAPAAASLLSIDVGGVLGPILQGGDPIHLAGDTFSATGAIDSNAVPIAASWDSATYDLSGNLQIMLGTLALTGYNAMLTITAPPSGPDAVILDFSVTEFNFTPDAAAFLTLPPGTLDGTEIQKFWVSISEPDGSLSYSVPGLSDVVTGTLGITGDASIGGTAQSSAPEPGTAGLLAIGLALAIAWIGSRQAKAPAPPAKRAQSPVG